MSLDHLFSTVTVGIVMLIAFVVMRAAYGYHVRLHGYSYTDAIKEGGSAAAIRFIGIFFGSTLAFWGVLAPTELGIVNDLIKITQCLVLVIAFMVIAGYVNDVLILNKIDNLKAIFKEGNVSVALVESGSFIATGLIFAASQTGDSTFMSNVLWFIGGQVLLIISVFAFALLHGGAKGIDEMHESMNRDNRGYAFAMFGYIVSIGLVLHVVIKNVERPTQLLPALLMWLFVTFLLQFATNRLMVPGTNLKTLTGNERSPNTGAGTIQGCMFLASALVITILN